MHFAPLFRAHEPSRAWDQSPHNIDLYAKNSTVLRALLADASIPRSQGTQRFLPTGLIFRWILPNLQDCKLTYATLEEIQESADDTELVPLSVPPLRGRLTLTCFTWENLVKDMIILFGGLRFRSMDFYMVKCAQLFSF